MTTITTHNNKEIFIHYIEENTHTFLVKKLKNTSQLTYFDKGYQYDISMCKGDYKIVGLLKDLKDNDVERYIEKYDSYETEIDKLLDGMFEDYIQEGNYWVQDSSGIKLWAFKTAKESFISLLKSKGVDVEKNLLILEKQ